MEDLSIFATKYSCGQVDAGIVDKLIVDYEKNMVDAMVDMIAIKAISTASGGSGESKRADFLEKMLVDIGIKCKRYDYKDNYGVLRPNLVGRYGGKDRTLWIIAHMDTVAEGDISLWKSDPFNARVSNGRIYGRGTNDNGQGIISAMYAINALIKSGAEIKYNIGIAIVADEEMGSTYGIQKLLDEDIFSKNDMFLVPDWGNERGDLIETAEKGMLWLKITVLGKQVHASIPDNGINASRYGAMLALELDKVLHERFSAKNSIFDPNTSTFEMTKHEKNVDSVNIVPGTDIFYMDCRVLPEYRLDDVINVVFGIAEHEKFKKVSIKVETYNREDAVQPTAIDSEIVRLLQRAVKEIRGKTPGVTGIGGGTCAAFFRKRGMQTAVWATLGEMAHQPNEYARIADIVNDAKVFARLYF